MIKVAIGVWLFIVCVNAQNFASLIYSGYPTQTTPVYLEGYDPMSSNECNKIIFENEGLGKAQSVLVCTECDTNSPVYFMLGTYDFIPDLNSSQYIVTYMESTGSNKSFPIIYEGDFKPWLFFSASPVKDPTKIPTIALSSDYVHKFFQTGYLDSTTGIFTVLVNHTTQSRVGSNYYRIINFQYDWTNSRFFVFGSLDAGGNFYVYEFGLSSGDSDLYHPISSTLWKYSSVYTGIGWDEQTQKLVVVGGQYGTTTQYYFFEIDLSSNSLVVLNTWKLPNSNYEIVIPDYPPPVVDIDNSLFWVNIPYLTGIYVNVNWVIFDVSSGDVVPLPSTYCSFAGNADAIAYVPSAQ